MRFANLPEFDASFSFVFLQYKFNPTIHSHESLLRFFPGDPADFKVWSDDPQQEERKENIHWEVWCLLGPKKLLQLINWPSWRIGMKMEETSYQAPHPPKQRSQRARLDIDRQQTRNLNIPNQLLAAMLDYLTINRPSNPSVMTHSWHH